MKKREKQRVLLVNPWYQYKQHSPRRYARAWPPLDLITAAALLEAEGCQVAVVDANRLRLDLDEICQQARGYSTVFVTSASLDRWQCPHVDLEPFLLTVKAIRNSSTGTRLFVYGPHCSMKPAELLAETGADGLIIGEPEMAMVDICSGRDPGEVAGIVYCKDGRVIFTPPHQPADLTRFQTPAFHLLPEEGYSYEIMGNNFSLIETSRGCPFHCTFCAKKAMYGDSCRYKNIEQVERELDVLTLMGIKNLYFMDLEFTLNRKHAEAVCTLLCAQHYDFTWACQTRVDSVDEALLTLMKNAGCRIIHFGVESGSERVLQETQKRITRDDAEKGIRLVQKAGMEAVCFMLLGLPDETEEEMNRTLAFARELNPDYASFNIATPYPGTRFHEEVKERTNGLFPSRYTGKYDEKTLNRMAKKGFVLFYLRPKYIFSRLRRHPALLWKQIQLFISFVR